MVGAKTTATMKIKLLLVLIVALIAVAILLTTGVARAQAPEIALKDQPIEAIVTHYAKENGVDPKFALSVMACESGGSQSVISDGGRSRGVFQIQKPTWERFTKEMGEVLDYTSAMDQAKVAMWAFANDHEDEWTTVVALKKGGTYSFYSRQLHKHFIVKCSMIS